MASNRFNVSVPHLEWQRPDAPQTLGYHGAFILINDQEVARVQTIQETGVFTRTLTPIRELSRGTFGRVVDIVPGINEPYSLALTRVELWKNELHHVLGYQDAWVDLISMTRPFTLTKRIFAGQEVYRTVTYEGVWLSDATIDAWDASGDAVVRRSVNAMATSRRITEGTVSLSFP